MGSHLTKTPNEYIRWRYEFGEDKENLEKSTVKMTDEELELLKTPVPWEYEDDKGNLKREKRVIKELTGARKENEKGGWSKQLKTIDAKVEAREGLYRRALTTDNVE